MPDIERDGDELPRLSPGCDSTAQGDTVTMTTEMPRFIFRVVVFLFVRYL